MTTPELLTMLHDIFPLGRFFTEADGIHWEYSMDYHDPEEEPHDHLWDVYCDAAEALRTFGFGYKNSWADNDSCGFEVTLNVNGE